MKVTVLINLLLVLSTTVLTGESIYRYKYSTTTELFEPVQSYEYKGSGQPIVRDIAAWIEDDFDVKIAFSFTTLTDSKKNSKSICTVDIHTRHPLSFYFAGPGHESLLILSTIANFLQPGEASWFIYAIVLKIDGIFSDELNTDSVYYPIITRASVQNDTWYKHLLQK
jgi:hypothetical protein